jgi:hypothetical protein
MSSISQAVGLVRLTSGLEQAPALLLRRQRFCFHQLIPNMCPHLQLYSVTVYASASSGRQRCYVMSHVRYGAQQPRPNLKSRNISLSPQTRARLHLIDVTPLLKILLLHHWQFTLRPCAAHVKTVKRYPQTPQQRKSHLLNSAINRSCPCSPNF